MADVGPSPLIPFLMLITLWYIIYGHSVVNSVSLVSQFEKLSLDFLVIIPILVLLLLVFSTQSIVVPLILILVVYMVSTALLGPLILIILIYVFSVGRFDNVGGRGRYDDDDNNGYERDGDNRNVGCGSILFIVIFLVLLGMFYQGEGYDWRTALLVIVIFILCNLFWF